MVCPRRAGVPFVYPTKRNPKKSPLREPGYLGLRLGTRETNSHAAGVLRQVPPVAPDAAPSARPNPLRGSLDPKTAALVKRTLRNPQPRPTWSALAGQAFLLSTTQKGTKKVTAEGTGLPWLAFRRCEANSHATGVLRQVPPVAPDAAPSLRPNPLGGSLDPKTAALVKRALRNPQPRTVACPRRAGVPFCLPHKKEPKKSPLRAPVYLGLLLGAVRQTRTPQACSDKCLP